MGSLQDIWGKYNPTFLVIIDSSLKEYLDLMDIAKQTCLVVGLDFNQVFITYDRLFIQFDRIVISDLKKYFQTYQRLVVANTVSRDILIPSVQFYGKYHGLYDRTSLDTKYLIALGDDIITADYLEDIDYSELHRAIQTSFKLIPS